MNRIENILLMGCDVANEIYTEDRKLTEAEHWMRSDTIIIVSVNREKGSVKLASLARDVWVDIPGYGKGKLNSPIVYGGPELAIKVINDTFHLEIEKYVMINIRNMTRLIDQIGGMNIELADEEAEYIDDRVPEVQFISDRDEDIPDLKTGGVRHLNGTQTVAHARNRTQFTIREREERDNELVIEMMRKIRSEMSFTEAALTAIKCLRYVKTNIGPADGLRLLCFGWKADLKNIETYMAPEEGTFEVKTDRIWRIEMDSESASERLWTFLKS